jgi:hypothetical protein
VEFHFHEVWSNLVCITQIERSTPQFTHFVMQTKFQNNSQKMFSVLFSSGEHISYAKNFVFWVRYQALKSVAGVCGSTQTQTCGFSAEYCGHFRRKCLGYRRRRVVQLVPIEDQCVQTHLGKSASITGLGVMSGAWKLSKPCSKSRL